MLIFSISIDDVPTFCNRLSEATRGASVDHVAYQSDGNISVADAFAEIAMLVYDDGFLPSKPELKKRATDARYAKEIGGIIVDGVMSEDDHVAIATDRLSRSALNSLADQARRDKKTTTHWKTLTGDFVKLDADRIIALADVVAGFVNRCFGVEAILHEDIEAGIITSTDQVDNMIAEI
jgi:hypothetical protein